MQGQGQIARYVNERGFGFIAADDGNELFFHVRDADLAHADIVPGLLVAYRVGEFRGRPCAVDVRLA